MGNGDSYKFIGASTVVVIDLCELTRVGVVVWRAAGINGGSLKLSLVAERDGTIMPCELDTSATLCVSVDTCAATLDVVGSTDEGMTLGCVTILTDGGALMLDCSWFVLSNCSTDCD